MVHGTVGGKATVNCENCGQSNAEDARFCTRCGARLRSRGGGERRHLTLMFADIVDSTVMASTLDPEDWRVLLTDCIAMMEHQVRRHGGHVAKLLGDGLMSYFGWPDARGNDMARAARAALAIQRDMAGLADRVSPDSGGPLALRIGIHAGMVVVGDEGEIYGDPPHIASRLQEVAEPGTIYVTHSLHRVLQRDFAVADAGRHWLKGIGRPMHLYRLLGTSSRDGADQPSGDSPRAPFLGREAALAKLASAADSALSGNGQAVLISGEAGIGKTRLVQEFRRRHVADNVVWLEARGNEIYANSPYFAVVDLLERALRLERRPTAAARAQALAGFLRRSGVAVERLLPELQSILAAAEGAIATVQSTGDREVFRNDLVNGLLALVRRRPTVLVVEDLHWIDLSTLEALRALVHRLREAPLLLLLTAREGQEIELPSDDSMQRLALAPLDAAETRELIVAEMGAKQVAVEDLQRIVERSGGIPLFAEELAWHLSERGADDDIPDSLAGLLAARLDRIGDAKAVAQVAAAVGSEFTAAFLAEVVARPIVEVEAALVAMQQSGLVTARLLRAQQTYAFRHALVRDVAYGQILRDERRNLHGRIARAMISDAAPETLKRPEIKAHHLALAEQWQAAAEAWQEAARDAVERHGYADAETAYAEALKALSHLPTSPELSGLEIGLLRDYSEVLQIVRGYTAPSTMDVAQRLQEAMRRAGQDAAQDMVYLVRTWSAVSSLGNYEDAAYLADLATERAQASGKPEHFAGAFMMQMTTAYRRGQLVEADAFFRAGETAFRSEAFNQFPGAVAQTFGNAARVAWILGDAESGRERVLFARTQAERKQSPYDRAFALYMEAILDLLEARFELADEHAQLSLDLSEAGGFPQFSAISRIVQGRARAAVGAPEQGIAGIRSGLDGLRVTKSRVALTMYRGWLAEALMLAGRHDEAEAAARSALNVNPQELFYRPELLRLMGELQSVSGRPGATETLREAADLAESMKAATFVRRIADSLGRLSQTWAR